MHYFFPRILQDPGVYGKGIGVSLTGLSLSIRLFELFHQFHHFEKIVVTMHTTTTTFPGVFFLAALLRAFSRSMDDLISFDSEVL